MIVVKIVMALSVNAVPMYGVFRLGWSAPTVLALYWLENLMVAVFTSLRIALHRHWTGKRGHWRPQLDMQMKVNDKPLRMASFLGEYAAFAFIFTLAHGVFVVAICALLSQNYGDQARFRFSFQQLRRGAVWMGALLLLDLLVDVPRLRHGTFAWLKQAVQRRMGRVLVLHLAIIIGMFAMAAERSPFSVLYVLFGLKTLVDVGSAFGAGDDRKTLVAKRGTERGREEDLASDEEEVRPPR